MKFIISAVATLICCLAMSCNRHDTYIHESGMIWNTRYNMTYRADSAQTTLILGTLDEVAHSVSPFDSTSLVSALNRGEAVTADTHLRRVFGESQRVNAVSGGAFDPTLAPLINLWGFGYRNGDGDVTDDEIAAAMQHVGIAGCSIDADGVIHKKTPQTEFNFSAIAKGYGVDCVAEALASRGITDYMVEIGGEIALSGRNPQGGLWNIQIDAPETDNLDDHAAVTVITVTDCCIATSGNYRNYRESADGSRYGHTISAVTGRPVATSTLSATVIAPTCMLADALATACMTMEPDAALAMIETVDGASCLLVTDNAGRYALRTSQRWPQ